MAFQKWRSWWQFLVVALLALLLYWPIAGNSFLNDDFIVIKRVCIDGQFFVPGFFRPLSDLSILITYKVFGLNPCWFYLTAILLHAFTTVLLFHLCLSLKSGKSGPWDLRFAYAASLLFFTYPFHNESVAWILGRGALMANTFVIAALLILTKPYKEVNKMLLVCLFYFAGFAAYETVVVLPVMVWAYLLYKREPAQRQLTWIFALSASLGLHIVIRYHFAGSILGEYGGAFLEKGPLNFLLKALKALGRTVLPPSDSTRLMTIALVVVLALAVVVFYYTRKRVASQKEAVRLLYLLLTCYLVSLLIPGIAGVSTRTSETDRLLHLPSYFLCMIAAFCLVSLVNQTRILMVIIGVVVLINIYWLEQNNLRWRQASHAVRDILEIAKSSQNSKVYVANLPAEIDGAYVFRVGFPEALEINGIDTAKVKVLSRLARNEGLRLPSPIKTDTTGNGWTIPPVVRIDTTNGGHVFNGGDTSNGCWAQIGRPAVLVYWDKKQWQTIKY